MSKPTRLSLLAALATALFPVLPAMAETLHCRSVNGNTTCAGSGAVSCQTINGRTTCISGGGGVVQQFGAAPMPAPPSIAPPGAPPGDAEDGAESRWQAERSPRPRPGGSRSIERRDSQGGWLSLQREGSRLRLRTESLAIDLD